VFALKSRISSGFLNSLEIEPLEQQQMPRLAAFLAQAFGPDTPPGFVDSSFMKWKFFEPYPGWEQRRSYVVQQKQTIVAHASLWPTIFLCSGTELRCGHILDWAGSPSAPGAGITIYRHLLEMTESAFVVGGSEQAKRLLPRIGFQTQGVQRTYVRVVRPWKQFRSRPFSSPIRDLGRLARNTFWSLGAIPSLDDWSAQPSHQADSTLDFLVSSWKPVSYCVGKRSAALVNYLLGCPLARNVLYNLTCSGKRVGYFILNTLGGQCRIVDMFIGSEERETWQKAYSVALRTAAAMPHVCEVAAVASAHWLCDALESLGLHRRQEKLIFIYDPRRRTVGVPPFLIQMVDSDAFYMHSPSFPYFT
jgi:Acetyltransferase (GNAT) domain